MYSYLAEHTYLITALAIPKCPNECKREKRVLVYELLHVYGVVFLLKVIVKSQAEQMLDEQLYKAL